VKKAGELRISIRQHGLEPYLHLGQHESVALHATREMKILCPYCRDERQAYKWRGGWWHEVSRGETSQSEPCAAAKLRNATV